jgi:O-antigen ligase
MRGSDRRSVVRGIAAGAAFAATLAIASQGAHAPLNIQAGQPARFIAAAVPLLAAIVAAWSVLRPWPAIVAVLLLTPVWNVAQVSWDVPPIMRTTPPFQVIAQTVFAVALVAGAILRDRRVFEPQSDAAAPTRHSRIGLLGWAAVAGLLILATVSTISSPNTDESLAVLLHGIVEPVVMGGLVLALVRTRRDLFATILALGLSVAIGGALNMIQSIPAMGTLGALQARRLLFSRLTYFNVGLFGEMLAMAAPLLIGALAARRYLRLPRAVLALICLSLAVGGASLFLTFSKSAYLATAGGILVFLLLAAQTWRRRAAVMAVAVTLSAFVVPWPAVVLRPTPPLETAYRAAMFKLVGPSRYYSWDPATISGRGSLVERLYATEAAFKMAADNPLLGVGLDQFGREYATVYHNPTSHFAADSAHTFWPEIAAELGLPALGLVVLIFLAALVALWRVYRAPPDRHARILAVTLLAALAAWLTVATAFAGDMYRPWRNMSSDFVMMAVLVAAAFALSRIAQPRTRATEPARLD